MHKQDPHPFNSRPALEDLKPAQLAPMEARFTPDWPDSWREISISVYCSLLGAASSQAPEHLDALAELAEAVTMGVVEDLGGRQFYVTVGRAMLASARAQRVIELVNSGLSYEEVSAKTGLVERYVRRLHTEWYYEEQRRRQPSLLG